MAEIAASNNQKKKGRFFKTHNRRSTRVDLTPMVDLGFLLITFFVFTAVMGAPKAMDLTETHDGEQRVKNSAAMTIIAGKDHTVFFYEGALQLMPGEQQIKKTDMHSVRSLIAEKKKETDPDYLMFIIKADKESTFGDHIALLDEMAICRIQSGHYAEVDMTPREAEIINLKK